MAVSSKRTFRSLLEILTVYEQFIIKSRKEDEIFIVNRGKGNHAPLAQNFSR